MATQLPKSFATHDNWQIIHGQQGQEALRRIKRPHYLQGKLLCMFTFQQSQLHFVMCGQPFIILSTKF
jgi:hypothetical protein